jgi:hypothetical protein
MANKNFEQGATPINNNFSVAGANFMHNKTVTKNKIKNGEVVKSKTFDVEKGFKIFKGSLPDGSQIIGVAVERNKLKNLTKDGNHKDLSKWATYTGNHLSASIHNKNSLIKDTDNFAMRFFYTNKGYLFTPIIEKIGFEFKAMTGYQLEADFTNQRRTRITQSVKLTPDGTFAIVDKKVREYDMIADGDLTIVNKVNGGYTAGKTKISVTAGIDLAVGLKSGLRYGNISNTHKNIKLMPNAISTGLGIDQQINSQSSIGMRTELVTTPVGGKFSTLSYYQVKKDTFFINFQAPTKGYGGGSLNLVPNSTLRTGGGYGHTGKKVELRVNGGHDFNQQSPYASGSLIFKINTNPKKRKP